MVSQHSLESHEVMCYLAARTVREKTACPQPGTLLTLVGNLHLWGVSETSVDFEYGFPALDKLDG